MTTGQSAGVALHAVDRDNPWPGLAAFEEGDRDYFKGRDDEIAAAQRLIAREDLTLLWGFSGLGKTSLLKAGLFPRLREAGIFPVHVRLRYERVAVDGAGREGGMPAPATLAAQCFDAIRQAAERWHYEIPAKAPSGTIWEYMRRRTERFWGPGDRLAVPLLVFDQFEELFTHDRDKAPPPEEVQAFFQDLSDAVAGRPPDWLLRQSGEPATDVEGDYLFQPGVCKVLLSFREDFLAQVAGLTTLVRAIDHNYYRLGAMTFERALAVVREAGGHLIDDSAPGVKDAVCRRIVERVAAAPTPTADDSATVDPALLSLFCRELNENRRTQQKPLIDLDLVESGAASQIISGFYESCMRQVSEAARQFVEGRLVLVESRSRDSLAEETALQSGVTSEELDFLIGKRILRREDTTRRGQPRLELTHDVLVEPALAARSRREAEQQRLREEREVRERAEAEREAQEQQQQARELALVQERLVLAEQLAVERERANAEVTARREAERTRDAAEQNRLRQELAAKALLAHRRNRYLAVVAAGGLIAIVIAVVAWRVSSELRVLLPVQKADAQLGHDPQLSTIYSAQAAEQARGQSDGVRSLALAALHRSVLAASHLGSSFQWKSAGVPPVISPDGARLALIGDGGRNVEVREGAVFERVAGTFIPNDSQSVAAVAFFPTGTDLLLVYQNGAMVRADFSSGTAQVTPVLGAMTVPADITARAAAAALRTVSSVAFDLNHNSVLLVSRFIPSFIPSADPTAPRTTGRWWASVADLERGVWRSDVAIEASEVWEVVPAGNGQRYVIVGQNGLATVMDANGRAVARHQFEPFVTIRVSGDGTHVVVRPPSTSPEGKQPTPSVTMWTVEKNATSTIPLPGRDDVLAIFSPDGGMLAVVQAPLSQGPGIAQVWNLETGRTIFAAPIPARGLVFSPDSQDVLTWDEAQTAQLWSLSGMNRRVQFTGQQQAIDRAAIAPQERGPIVTMSSSMVNVWSRAAVGVSIETGIDAAAAVAIAPGGTSFAAAGNRRFVVRGLATTRDPIDIAVDSDVHVLAYASDGRRLALGLESGTIVIRALDGRVAERRIEDPRRGPITALAFSSGGASLAYAVRPARAAEVVAVRDVESGSLRMEQEVKDRVIGLEISPDGRRIAIATAHAYEQSSHAQPSSSYEQSSYAQPSDSAGVTFAVLDVALSHPSAPSPSSELSPSPDEPSASAGFLPETSAPDFQPSGPAENRVVAAINRDLTFAVSSDGDSRLVHWTLPGTRKTPLPFEDGVRVVAVAPDGRHFAAGGERGLLKLYSTDRMNEPVVLEASGPAVRALAFSEGGDRLAGVDADGTVTIYEFGLDSLLARARTIIGSRSLSEEECRALGAGCLSDSPTWLQALRQLLQSVTR